MLVFLLLFLINTSCGFSKSLTGPESINPSMEEISRCVPETMQESVTQAIRKLPQAAKITEALYKIVSGSFAKNCKMLARQLRALDMDELLSEENIISKFKEEDKEAIVSFLKDENTGLKNFLYIIENLELHLAGYVSILHGMLNMKLKLDIIDLIHTVDLIQRGSLELQENFQLLSYLSFANENIEGYGTILEGIRHQLSFKIIAMVNTLSTVTEDLRATYLSLLDKGDCNGDQITLALGLNQKKISAIQNED